MTLKQLHRTAIKASRESLHVLKLLGHKEPNHPRWIEPFDHLSLALSKLHSIGQELGAELELASSRKSERLAEVRRTPSKTRSPLTREERAKRKLEVKRPAKN